MRLRKYYPTVDELFTLSEPPTNPEQKYTMWYLFSKNHLFDGTLTYKNSEGETVNYPAVGPTGDVFNPAKLSEYWFNKYDERRAGFPLKGWYPFISDEEKAEKAKDTITKLNIVAENFTAAVQWKYLELLKTTAETYDPITAPESKEVVEKTYGTETLTHTPTELSGKSINANAPHVEFGLPEAGHPANIEINDWDSNEANTTTTTHGLTQTETFNNVKDQQTLDKTNAHYTTTYDDSSNTRLESRDVESGSPSNTKTGSITNANSGNDSTTEKLTQNATVQNFNSETYTDTRAKIGSDKEERSRFNLSGEKLKEARELALINIIDMYFEELNNQILLSVWG